MKTEKWCKIVIGILAIALTVVIALLVLLPIGEVPNEPSETPSPTMQITEEPTHEPSIENSTELVEKEPILFSEDITFDYSWVSDGDHMPYALYTPSCADEYDEIPLIVWLHGTGQIGVSEWEFRNWSLPAVMENWTLEGFNAYVLCAQLSAPFNNGTWNNPTSMGYVKVLIDIFISEHNVDRSKVYILGHSLGAVGCVYMAHEMPEYFAACVPMCPYYQGFDITEIEIPVMVYVGSPGGGEDEISYRYALKISDALGDDSVTVFPTSHGGVPKMAFNLDEDENNRSDLLEWLLNIDKEDY